MNKISKSRFISIGFLVLSFLTSFIATLFTRAFISNSHTHPHTVFVYVIGAMALLFWSMAIVFLFRALYIVDHYIHFSEPIIRIRRIDLLNVASDEFIWPGDQFLRFEDLDEDERSHHYSGQSEPGICYVYAYNDTTLASGTIPVAMTRIHYAAHSRPCIHISEKVIYLEDTWGFPPERLEVHDRREFHYDLFLPEEWAKKIS